jgi:hypothetical protein
VRFATNRHLMPGLRRNGVLPPLPKLTWCAQWHCTYSRQWSTDIASSVELTSLHIFTLHRLTYNCLPPHEGGGSTGMAPFFINLGLEESDDQFHAPAALPPVYIYWHAALHMQLRRFQRPPPLLSDTTPLCIPFQRGKQDSSRAQLIQNNGFQAKTRVSRNCCVQQILLQARQYSWKLCDIFEVLVVR